MDNATALTIMIGTVSRLFRLGCQWLKDIFGRAGFSLKHGLGVANPRRSRLAAACFILAHFHALV
jgi:hypothetical protein